MTSIVFTGKSKVELKPLIEIAARLGITTTEVKSTKPDHILDSVKKGLWEVALIEKGQLKSRSAKSFLHTV